MITRLTAALMLSAALAAPALADSYPVSGAYGQTASSDKGPVNCDGLRVITFSDNQRTDSKGGVPAYRNKSVVPESASRYRVVDIFTTGQISNGQSVYTLNLIDDDHIEMNQQVGGLIKLRRCK